MTCFREHRVLTTCVRTTFKLESPASSKRQILPRQDTQTYRTSPAIYTNTQLHAPIKLSFAAIACATDLQGFNNNKLDRRPLPATMMATKMIELESQEEAVETMIRVATVAHVRASRGLRLLAFAASLAAALVVVTNRQDHWGVTATFTMFQVWVYVYIYLPSSTTVLSSFW
jgi:hypothetical protein